jgi:hypothetical protein
MDFKNAAQRESGDLRIIEKHALLGFSQIALKGHAPATCLNEFLRRGAVIITAGAPEVGPKAGWEMRK